MKNGQFFIVIVLLSVVCTSHSIKDGDDILKPLHDKIKDEFINRSSAYVAKQIKKNKPVSHDFQNFLDNDESIKKMTQTYGDGTGRFAIEVINKKNEIINDCKCKRDELNAENKTSILRERDSMVGFTCGAILGIIGLSTLAAGKSTQPLGAVALAGGLGIDVLCWKLWSWAVETQQEKQAHIAEISKIEEKLDRNFVEMQKNIKHNHMHPHTII